MSITIITPTYNRDKNILLRCIKSVDSQIYQNFKHVIIVDDEKFEPHISSDFIDLYSNDKRTFIKLGYRSNNYGNTPRQTAINNANTDYIVFLDDDNIIFPNYLSELIKGIDDYDIGICKIVHLGPLPPKLYPPPKILDGNPPVLQNIDTLQVMVKTIIMKKEGWEVDKGYLADGYTIHKLCSKNNFVFINEILGIHM
jgi:glycosyltransferase involved in cell wall biosynthesis